MTTTSRDAIIKRTSEMMLSGWKMLAISCPICSTALMMSKQGGMRCPGCDMPVMTESQSQESRAEKLSGSSNSEAKVPSQLPFESFEELKKEYDAKNKHRDSISTKLGQFMLSGWTMMGHTCQNAECAGTPLMSKSELTPKLCVGCNTEYIADKSGDMIPFSSAQSNLSTGSQEKSINSSGATIHSLEDDSRYSSPMPRAQQQPDASALIAQELMKGSAMLNEVCEEPCCRGEVPLLRRKDGKKVCVVCLFHAKNDKPIEKSIAPTQSTVAAKPAAVSTSGGSVPRASTVKQVKVQKQQQQLEGDDNTNDSFSDDEGDDEDASSDDSGDSEARAVQLACRLGRQTVPTLPPASKRVAATTTTTITTDSEVGLSHKAVTCACRVLSRKLIMVSKAMKETDNTEDLLKLAQLMSQIASTVREVAKSR